MKVNLGDLVRYETNNETTIIGVVVYIDENNRSISVQIGDELYIELYFGEFTILTSCSEDALFLLDLIEIRSKLEFALEQENYEECRYLGREYTRMKAESTDELLTIIKRIRY